MVIPVAGKLAGVVAVELHVVGELPGHITGDFPCIATTIHTRGIEAVTCQAALCIDIVIEELVTP